jgi:hypothetical protein
MFRPFSVPATLTIVLWAAAGSAQTVIVRHVPVGASIEVVFDAASVGSATPNADGDATVKFSAVASRAAETAVRVSVELCDNLRRVLLVEPGASTLAPTPGCERREAPELYVLRPVTTLVIDVARPDFTVRIRQGPAPQAWMRDVPPPPRVWRRAPGGLVIMGGGGGLQFADVRTAACGDATTCTVRDSAGAVAAGLEYGFSRFVSAQGTYVRPSTTTASGSGTGFRFDTTQKAQIVAFAGKVGGQAGPLKLYGLAGGTYHRLSSTTTNTLDDTTLTVGDATQTAAGGTTTIVLRAQGWGWLFGGGAETWLARRFAVYGEVALARLSSSNVDGPEGVIDDFGRFVVFGAKVHVGPR